MIDVREATEHDVEGICEIFRVTYGEDYCYPQFYDPTFIKRLVFAQDTVMIVAVDTDQDNRVLGTASVLEQRGAYSDLTGEFGRLAVHPDARNLGIGALLMEARLNHIKERLHVGIMDARLSHPFSCKIAVKYGFRAVGFLPRKIYTERRENVALLVQHFGPALELRRNHPHIIPEGYPLACAAMENCGIPCDAIVDAEEAPYPYEDSFSIRELSSRGYSELLRIERGRTHNREVFGPLRLHYGFFKLTARNSRYLMAKSDGVLAGAVGVTIDESDKAIQIFELIALNDNVIRYLLQELLERALKKWDIKYAEIDVSAYAPRMQRTLLELGFFPAAYVPARVFHEVERLDVMKMVYVTGRPNLTRDMYIPEVDSIVRIVRRGFEKGDPEPRIIAAVGTIQLFSGLTDEQIKTLVGHSSLCQFRADTTIFREGDAGSEWYIVLSGTVAISHEGNPNRIGTVTSGETLGEVAALSGSPHSASATTTELVEAARLTSQELEEIIRRRPDIGVVIYRNLAIGLGEKLKRADSGI